VIPVTVAIPTYQRGAALVDSISRLLALTPPPAEILAIDQTSKHPPEIESTLHRLVSERRLKWLRLPEPCIPAAMNRALLDARHELILFLDDDVIPTDELIAAHAWNYENPEVWCVVGQILEADESPTVFEDRAPAEGLNADLDFPFYSAVRQRIRNVMAGNLSVLRNHAMEVGGFDENFVGAGYRFETDFARRILAAGGEVWFEPAATVQHLKLATGGLRSYGDHLRSSNPAHSVGDYYFAYRNGSGAERALYILGRLRKSVLNRFTLTRPWWILPKLLGEFRGLKRARQLSRQQPRLLKVPERR
jgi:GT2 family glycosyltransferase